MSEENKKNEYSGLHWDDIKNTIEDTSLSDISPSLLKMEDDSFEEFFEEKKREDPGKNEYITKIPKAVFWEELEKESFPKQSWRINKLIPKEGFVILASISGNRKTWVAMEMAKNIVEGNDFLGDENFKTEGANVLYIDIESPRSEIQRRGKQLGFKSKTLHKLFIIKEDNLNLNQDEADIWLKSFIEFHEIKVVFVDTFISVSGGISEDKAETIRQFFNKFNSLKNKGVVVVWLMHLRKPNYFEGKTPKKEQLLGSQDKTASVEVLLMIHSEPGSEEISMYQRKNRLGIEIEPFKIIMKDSIDENEKVSTLLTYGGPIEESENKKDQAKEIIMEILEEGTGKTTKEILEITSKQVGSKNTRQALNELVKDGLVEITKRGKSNYYVLKKENKALSSIEGF